MKCTRSSSAGTSIRRARFELHRLEAVDVAQRHLDDLAPVVGLEAYRRGDVRLDMEHAVAHDLTLVELALVPELQRRRAQPLFDLGRMQRVHPQHERTRCDQPVVDLDVLEAIDHRESVAAERRKAAVELWAINRQELRELELVLDLRPDDVEVGDRLVEPTKRGPRLAFDVVPGLFERLARGGVRARSASDFRRSSSSSEGGGGLRIPQYHGRRRRACAPSRLIRRHCYTIRRLQRAPRRPLSPADVAPRNQECVAPLRRFHRSRPGQPRDRSR